MTNFKVVKNKYNDSNIKKINLYLFYWWIFKHKMYRKFYENLSTGMAVKFAFEKVKKDEYN